MSSPTLRAEADFYYIGRSTEARIDANLKLRYSVDEYAELLKSFEADRADCNSASFNQDLLSLKREHYVALRYLEIMSSPTTPDDNIKALIKCVTMFKPDLLHLNMRVKSALLRLSADLCLLQRPDLTATARKARIDEVNTVLNMIASADRNGDGAIK
jgi:hypothetical protein